VRAEDMGGFWRIPADARDLNYAKFFTDGETRISEAQDYTSHNTERMDVDALVHLLSGLDYIQRALRGDPASDIG